MNCLHMLPQLRELETQFADELVVIGVHSAKFPEERVTTNIREAIRRHEVTHPVVNDANMIVWRQYNVYAWPTLVLIDPEGYYVGHHAGEIPAERLAPVIERLIAEFQDQIDRRPLDLTIEPPPPTPFAYPGKVLPDPEGERLFVADTNHHRIVVMRLDAGGTVGKVETVIGRGVPGLDDGSFEEATFNHPQGLALLDDTLYVADAENHALRAVDFSTRTVRRVAGTGELGWAAQRGPGTGVALNSPWDVVAVRGMIFIAMAGRHQIWAFDPATGEVGPFAGNGREDLVDGPLAHACFAQPSGLTTDGRFLYVADSETSSVRRVDLDGGRVETLVGTGLFDFGDVDGRGRMARLQHPLGVAWADGLLYVADTYNHKVKVLDLNTLEVRSWLGSGQPGWQDGSRQAARFYEPGDVKVAGDRLYVADTNNHAVRVVDRRTGEVHTLRLRGLERLVPPDVVAEVRLPPFTLAAGTARFAVRVELPAGFVLSADMFSRLEVQSESGDVVRPRNARVLLSTEGPTPVEVETRPGTAFLVLDLHIFACRKGAEALCLFHRARLRVPVHVVVGGGEDTATVVYQVPLKS